MHVCTHQTIVPQITREFITPENIEFLFASDQDTPQGVRWRRCWCASVFVCVCVCLFVCMCMCVWWPHAVLLCQPASRAAFVRVRACVCGAETSARALSKVQSVAKPRCAMLASEALRRAIEPLVRLEAQRDPSGSGDAHADEAAVGSAIAVRGAPCSACVRGATTPTHVAARAGWSAARRRCLHAESAR